MKLAIIATLPLLALAACSVENDPANDQVTVSYDQNVAENAAEDVGNALEDAGAAAERTGEAIENEVGDVDIDVDIDRNKNEANTNSN